jgi:hypothetical protein
MSDERPPDDSRQPPAWPAPPEPPQQPSWPPVPSGPGYSPRSAPPGYGGSPYGNGAPYGAPPGYGQRPQPGAVHPLSVGRAFSLGWSIFRFRWRRLLGTSLVTFVPGYALLALWFLAYGELFTQWTFALQPDPLGFFPDPHELPPFPLEGILLYVLASILAGLAGIIGGGALVHMIGWTYGGGSAPLGRALRQALARLPSLVGAGLIFVGGLVLLSALGTGAAGVLLAASGVEPGPLAFLGLVLVVGSTFAVIYLSLRLIFFVQAVMLEGQGAMASLKRSWSLGAGSLLRLLGYLLLLGLALVPLLLVGAIVSVVLFGIGFDFATLRPDPYSATRTVGSLVVSGLATALMYPFVYAVLTLLYYDLRWRRGETLGPPPA